MLRPTLTLRPTEPADEAFLRRLFGGALAPEVQAMPLAAPHRAALIDSMFRGQTQAYRQQFPGSDDAIVLEGDVPVGRLIVHRSADALRVVDISLVPAARGRGLGGTLLRSVLDRAQAMRLPVDLRVRPRNPAIRLYSRLGFAPSPVDGAGQVPMRWTPAR